MIVRVRANNNLPGLSAGQETLVDTEVPYVQKCLRGGYLTPINDDGIQIDIDVPTPGLIEPPPVTAEVVEGVAVQDEAVTEEESGAPA